MTDPFDTREGQEALEILDASWEVSSECQTRAEVRFYEKLAARYPDHPWLKLRHAASNEGGGCTDG